MNQPSRKQTQFSDWNIDPLYFVSFVLGADHELALAYNNRSAALYHLKKYEMSLRDINMAIETGYPQVRQTGLGRLH